MIVNNTVIDTPILFNFHFMKMQAKAYIQNTANKNSVIQLAIQHINTKQITTGNVHRDTVPYVSNSQQLMFKLFLL